MQSDTIKKVGYGIMIAGIVIGIIMGSIFKTLSLDELDEVFNWVLMISLSLGGIVSGFFVCAIGTIVENQEYTNEYLKILAVLKEKEMGEN